MEIKFEVLGKPATAGSKRAIPYQKKNGMGLGVRVLHDCERFESWRGLVAHNARAALSNRPLITAPVYLAVEVVFGRPKGHFARAGHVLPSAPRDHIGKPDLTKIVRAVEDSLKGVIWRDDSQVTQQRNTKRYSDDYTADPPRTIVCVAW